MKLNNKGVSLIEVIVVIGIIAILSSVSIATLVYVNKGDIKKATKTLMSEINSARTYSMAKTGEWIFGVAKVGDKYVLSTICGDVSTGTVENYSEVELSNRVDDITVVLNNVGTYDPATGGMIWTVNTPKKLGAISFQKSTGAVSIIWDMDGNVIYNRSAIGASLAGYADITVNLDENKRTLRLYFLTGKIEQQ